MSEPREGAWAIAGTVAVHAVITDECRANRGDAGAIEEALIRVRREYEASAAAFPTGARFHVLLTVETPDAIADLEARLNAGIEQTERQIADIERAKKVSPETMQVVFNV